MASLHALCLGLLAMYTLAYEVTALPERVNQARRLLQASPLPTGQSPPISTPSSPSPPSPSFTPYPPSLTRQPLAPNLVSSAPPVVLPLGAVVGGVVGGVAFVVALTVGTIYLAKRIRRKRDDSNPMFPSGSVSMNSLPVGKGNTSSAGSLTIKSNDSLPPASSAATSKDALLSEVRIPWASIKVGRTLGKGGFGTVRQGIWQGNAVAIKMLNVERLSTSAREELCREALMMCRLRHPCIASVYGLVDDDLHTALIMRYYQRGTVAAAMNRSEYENLSLTRRLQMAHQVASGMCFLHERGILHGDLKTSNLLVEDTAKGVVLADFGLACMAGEAVASGALTVNISPPELLEQPTAPRTQAGDVYAFSIVLMEIVTGRFMYQGMNSGQVKYTVCSGKRPGIPDYVPEDVAAIIKACWAQEPSSRPTFLEVMGLLGKLAFATAGDEPNAHADGQGNTTRPDYTLADVTTTYS